jgi:ADP-heptose:LPS heptosyltransferase
LKEDELGRIRKILVIQLGPFGDALLTTSYFETLKRRSPEAKLFYLIKEPYDIVIRDHPLIDGIMVIRRRQGLRYALERLRTVCAIRAEGFDLVIDQQNQPSSQQLTFLSGARYRLGYADARFSWAYNLRAGRGPLRYSANRKFDILEPLGIEEEEYRLYFPIPSEAGDYVDTWLADAGLDARRLVCISPGSPVRKKRWKPESFAGLADSIQTLTDDKVILLWGPREVGDVEMVRALMRTEPAVAPPTDLHQAAALLRRCRLLVCNDGGLNHIAAAIGTPALAVFGTTDPAVWSPASVFNHHHHLYKPGFDSMNDDSFGISPDEAFGKVKEILAGPRGEHEA